MFVAHISGIPATQSSYTKRLVRDECTVMKSLNLVHMCLMSNVIGDAVIMSELEVLRP